MESNRNDPRDVEEELNEESSPELTEKSLRKDGELSDSPENASDEGRIDVDTSKKEYTGDVPRLG